MISIRCVTDAQEKCAIARLVLEQLTDWFGIESSREEYIAASAAWPCFAAYDDEKPIGFICGKQTGQRTAELAVMGILQPYHRRGIGRRLFAALKEQMTGEGYRFMQVKTVREGMYPEYDATNCFYRALGFEEFEVLEDLWDAANPCQIYIMAL